MSSEREQLLAGGKHGYGSARVASDVGEVVAQQRQQLLEQDERLEYLASSTRSVKHVATEISAEVDEQNAILDELERGVQKAKDKTQRAKQRADNVDKSPYSIANFCLLLWPLVLLLLIIAAFVHHLIFS